VGVALAGGAAVWSKCGVDVAAVLAATNQVGVGAVGGAAVVTGCDVGAAELAAIEQIEVTIVADQG